MLQTILGALFFGTILASVALILALPLIAEARKRFKRG